MSIITMATRITPENLPLVQACLPIGFLSVPPNTAFGAYLVINEIRVVTDAAGEPATETDVSIVNTWYNEGEFLSKYEALEDPTDHLGFFKVQLNRNW